MQNKLTHFSLLTGLTASLILGACAHHPDVRAGADGNHKVVVRAADEASSNREALSQANSFCKEQKKVAVVKTEKTQYTGAMREDTRKNIKAASNAAKIIGGLGGVGAPANPASTAGAVGGAMTGEPDYLTEMIFNCQ